MGHLLAVKEKLTTTENLFEPLQETMELLKTYGQELSDEVHQQLKSCPSNYTSCLGNIRISLEHVHRSFQSSGTQ